MNINCLTGRSTSDLYVLLQQEGWGLGAPEGLAHYDGHSWRWVGRMDSGSDFVVNIRRRAEEILLFTACGQVHSFTAEGGLRVGDDTFVADLIEGNRALWEVSVHSGRVHPDGRLTLVGSNGAVFHKADRWTKIDTGVSNVLYSVVGDPPDAHIAGIDVVMSFDGERCFANRDMPGTPLLIADALSDRRWIAGGIRDGGGVLVHFGPTNEILGEVTIGPPAHSILAGEDDSVYFAMTYHGVQRWDGDCITPVLSPDKNPHLLARFGKQIVAGGGSGGPDSLFVFEGGRWSEIPIDLDMSYLDRG